MVRKIPTFLKFGWRKTNGKQLANIDLLIELAIAYMKCPNVVIVHIRRFVDVPGNTYLSRKVLRSLLTSGLCQG